MPTNYSSLRTRHSFQTLSTAGGVSKCCLAVQLMRGPAVGAGVKNGNGYVACTWQRQHECRKSTTIRLPLAAYRLHAYWGHPQLATGKPHNCALRLGLAHWQQQQQQQPQQHRER